MFDRGLTNKVSNMSKGADCFRCWTATVDGSEKGMFSDGNAEDAYKMLTRYVEGRKEGFMRFWGYHCRFGAKPLRDNDLGCSAVNTTFYLSSR